MVAFELFNLDSMRGVSASSFSALFLSLYVDPIGILYALLLLLSRRISRMS